jgi:hypothetical protein
MAEKVILELEVQTEKFKSELEAGVLNPLEAVSVEAKKVSKQIADNFDQAANNVGKAFAGQQVGAALQSIGKDAMSLASNMEEVAKISKAAGISTDKTLELIAKGAIKLKDQGGNAIKSTSKLINGLTLEIKNLETEADKFPSGIAASQKDIEKGFAASAASAIRYRQEVEKISKASANVSKRPTFNVAGDLVPGVQTSRLSQATKDINKVIAGSKTASEELKKLANAIATDKLSGESLQQATERAALLKKEITDTNKEIKLLTSDTRGIDALVTGAQAISAAFAVTSGVIGAFADNEEEAAEATRKVQSAISILLGVQELARIITDKNALSIKGLSVAQQVTAVSTNFLSKSLSILGITANTTSTSFKVLRGAVLGLGIGAVVFLLEKVISGLSDTSDKTSELNDKMFALSDTLKNQVKGSAESALDAFDKLIDAQIELDLARGKITSTEAKIQQAQNKFVNDQEQAEEERKKRIEETVQAVRELENAYLDSERGSEEEARTKKAFDEARIKQLKAADEISKNFNEEQVLREKALQAEITLIKIEATKERNKQLLELEKQLQIAQLAAERARLQFIVAASKEESALQIAAKQQLIAFELKASLAGLDIEQKERLAKLKELGIVEGQQVEAVQKEIANRRKLIQQESLNEANQLQNQFNENRLLSEEEFQKKIAEIELERIEVIKDAQIAADQIVRERENKQAIQSTLAGSRARINAENKLIQDQAKEQTDIIQEELVKRETLRFESGRSATEVEIAQEKLLNEERVRINEEANEQIKQNTQAFNQELALIVLDSINQLSGSISQINRNVADRRIQEIEEFRDFELKNAGLSAEGRLQVEEKAAKEIAKIKEKQAKQDRAVALFEAVINTAAQVTRVISNPPLAFLVAALGAVQIAAIASAPIPKFKKGGLVGGKPHEQGGTLIEAEKSEFVISKRRRERHPELTSALNESDGKLRKVLYDKYIRPDLLAPRMDTAKRLKADGLTQPYKFSTRNVESELQGLKKQGKRDTDRLIGVIQRNKEQIRNNW